MEEGGWKIRPKDIHDQDEKAAEIQDKAIVLICWNFRRCRWQWMGAASTMRNSCFGVEWSFDVR